MTSCHPIDEINRLICALIPKKNDYPVAYDVISKYMIHGLRGPCYRNSPCMKMATAQNFIQRISELKLL